MQWRTARGILRSVSDSTGAEPGGVEGGELASGDVHHAPTVEQVADSSAETQLGEAQPAATGKVRLPWRVGRYEVKDELARGGMGIVYRAVHTGLGRELALKVLRLERVGGDRELERFQLEARAAARLVHPNIVAVHDVGECAAGPFLVMDLVEGESLAARIAREGPLEPRAAASVVHALAGALAYAHAHAILHRDLKPANVLLSTSGAPLIADFGLARDLTTQDRLTETGLVVGTPSYMAPEQARGDVDAVDRRSDVYSLGATLYEALTGAAPFEGATALLTLRRVLMDDPVPPSKLAPGIDADLETICLKCLEKEPHLRYGSAAALEEDLRRYLASEPITAARPSVVGRARRWLRRNPTLTRTIASFSAGAVALGTLGTVAFVRRLSQERDLADRRAAIARDTIDVLVYEVRDGLRDVPGARARAVRRALLERAQRGLELLTAAEEEDGGRASVRVAEVHRQIGEIALTLGDTAGAQASLDRAVEVLRGITAAGGPDAASARSRLADVLVEAGQARRARGDLEGARGCLEESLATQRTARGLTALAEVFVALGQLERARHLLEEALRRRRDAAEQDASARLDLAAALVALGGLARRQGALSLAVERYDEALLVTRALVREQPTPARRRALADHLVGAADARTDQGDHAGASERFEEALVAYRGLVAADRESVPLLLGLSLVLQRLGDEAARRKDPARALERLGEALEVCRELEAKDREDERVRERTRSLLARTGEQRRLLGDLDGARAELEEAIARLRERLAAAEGDAAAREALALARTRLGQVLSAQGDEHGALRELQASAAALRALYARDGSNAQLRAELLVAIGLRGELLEDMGDLERARRCYEETLQIGEALLARDPTNARARANQAAGFIRLSLLVHRLGEVAEALVYAARAIETQRPLAPLDPRYADTLRWLEEVVVVEFTSTLDLVQGRRAPMSAVEHAELARMLLRKDDVARASDHFAAAFTAGELPGELAHPRLLAGARAAARASLADVERTALHRQRAVEWLLAGAAARRRRLAELEQALGDAHEPAARTPLLIERRRHERTLEALRDDPALAALKEEDRLGEILGGPDAGAAPGSEGR